MELTGFSDPLQSIYGQPELSPSSMTHTESGQYTEKKRLLKNGQG